MTEVASMSRRDDRGISILFRTKTVFHDEIHCGLPTIMKLLFFEEWSGFQLKRFWVWKGRAAQPTLTALASCSVIPSDGLSRDVSNVPRLIQSTHCSVLAMRC